MKRIALIFSLMAGAAVAQPPCDGLVLLEGTFPNALATPSGTPLDNVACKDGDAIVEGFASQVFSAAQQLTNFVLKIVSKTVHTLQFVITFDGAVTGQTPDGLLIQYTVGDPAHPQWVGVQSVCSSGPTGSCGTAAPAITMKVCGWQLDTSSCLGGDVWPEVITGSGGGGAVSTENSASITVLSYVSFWNPGYFFDQYGYTPLFQ
jgi:hypothetical protein